MQRISHKTIQKLARKNKYPSVSMYVPLEGDYYDLRDKVLRISRQAREQLLDHVDYNQAREILAPIYEAIHDRTQWLHEPYDKTIAMFIAGGEINIYALPDREEEALSVERGFAVSRLFDQLAGHGRFYNLLLTSKAAHLVRSDVSGVKTILKIAATESKVNTGSRQRRARVRAENNSSIDKRYLSRIDKEIRNEISDRSAPMIVVALPKMQAAYRAASRYELLMPEGLKLNPDSMGIDQIIERSRPIATQFYRYYEEVAQQELERRKATDQPHVATGIRSVIEALRDKRVQTLYINPKSAVWGEPLTRAVHLRKQRGDVNLTEEALRGALDTNAEIFNLPEGATNFRAAAILKY